MYVLRYHHIHSLCFSHEDSVVKQKPSLSGTAMTSGDTQVLSWPAEDLQGVTGRLEPQERGKVPLGTAIMGGRTTGLLERRLAHFHSALHLQSIRTSVTSLYPFGIMKATQVTLPKAHG